MLAYETACHVRGRKVWTYLRHGLSARWPKWRRGQWCEMRPDILGHVKDFRIFVLRTVEKPKNGVRCKNGIVAVFLHFRDAC